MAGVESMPLVGNVSRACRAVPGDSSGYRVPLPGSKLPSAAGSPGVAPDVVLVSAACLRPCSVARVIQAGVPGKAEIEAVGALGCRPLLLIARAITDGKTHKRTKVDRLKADFVRPVIPLSYRS